MEDDSSFQFQLIFKIQSNIEVVALNAQNLENISKNDNKTNE
jgi:hypothetical protein